jgi:membrane-bound metal-dependent hydrolase YbcI (DUF457 family)
MPDVLTHFLVGVSIALLVRKDGSRAERMLIILGAVLIDFERPFAWLLANTEFYWVELTPAFHSILGAVLLSYSAAACFGLEHTNFRERFKLILIGCTAHLLLDMTMYPWEERGLYLLYPLKITFSFNLLWPDFWWFPVIGAASLLVALGIRYMMTLTQSSKAESDS